MDTEQLFSGLFRNQTLNTQEIFDFKKLPKDLKILIFSFLDIKGLLKAACICWDWHNLINKNQTLFKGLCYKLWRVTIPDIKVENWKAALKSISKIYN